jgi:hypothetical protein
MGINVQIFFAIFGDSSDAGFMIHVSPSGSISDFLRNDAMEIIFLHE